MRIALPYCAYGRFNYNATNVDSGKRIVIEPEATVIKSRDGDMINIRTKL